jgi:hypothetical protein
MTKEQTKIELTAKQRAEQIIKMRGGKRPMDGLSSRFPQLPVREGFKTHWFNDEKGKIELKLQDGWTFSERPGFIDKNTDLVKNPTKRIGVRVGSKDDLSDLFAYAMDIPNVIHDEDRRANLEDVDRKERYMKTGKVEVAGGMEFQKESDIQTNQSNFQPD